MRGGGLGGAVGVVSRGDEGEGFKIGLESFNIYFILCLLSGLEQRLEVNNVRVKVGVTRQCSEVFDFDLINFNDPGAVERGWI